MSGAPDAAALEALRRAELFDQLDDGALQAAAAAARPVEVEAGAAVVRQGDPGDALFVVVEGRLQVLVAEPGAAPQPFAELGPGQLFGELQALAGGARSATVVARERCRLLQLSRAALDEAAQRSPGLGAALTALMLRRLQHNLLTAAVLRVLGPLEHETLAGLRSGAGFVHLRGGEVLFRQGDPGDAWFVVCSGRVRVVQRDAAGAEHVRRELGRGESIGELALLLGQPRTATVLAVRDSVLARFDAARFEQVMQASRGGALSLARAVVGRMAGLGGDTKACLNLAVVSAGGAAAEELARGLAEALRPLGSTLLLGPGPSPEMGELGGLGRFPEGHPAWLRFGVWLDERAADHRFLVFSAGEAATPWGRRALREADEVLLVADAGSEPGPVPPGLPAQVRRTLLLVHPEGTALPSGTARWLDAFGAARAFHLRRGRAQDLARVARLVAGKATALVLGAGGVRGAAHIGVLRVLAEQGIEIDALGGTSAGALAAAAFAMGATPDQLREMNRRISAQKPFGDFVLPISSLLRGRRLERALRLVFGDARLEDLWLPCFCTSCDTSVFREVVHERGPLVPALLAGSALPGVLPPYLLGGHMHVDGGTTCALPGKAMRARFAGTLIAVDVSTERDYLLDGEERYPTSWAALWRRWFPTPARPARPALPELFLRAVSIGTANAAEEVARDADLFLRPPVERFGTSELEASDEIERIGYEHARDRVAAWAKERGRG